MAKLWWDGRRVAGGGQGGGRQCPLSTQSGHLTAPSVRPGDRGWCPTSFRDWRVRPVRTDIERKFLLGRRQPIAFPFRSRGGMLHVQSQRPVRPVLEIFILCANPKAVERIRLE